MEFEIDTAPIRVNRDTVVKIPFNLRFNDSSLAYDVKVKVVAAGLKVENNEFNFSAIDNSYSGGEFEINISKTNPVGEYLLEIQCYFKTKNELLFLPTNSLKSTSIKRHIKVIVI
jgi:hypothetical protein